MKEPNPLAANDIKVTTPPGSTAPAMIVHIYLENCFLQSFVQAEEATAWKTWEAIDPVRLFTQTHVVIAGTYSEQAISIQEVLAGRAPPCFSSRFKTSHRFSLVVRAN